MTLHDHAQRIAHQDGVHAGTLKEPGHGVVVGGEHRQAQATALGRHKVRNSHGLVLAGFSTSAVDLYLLRCGHNESSQRGMRAAGFISGGHGCQSLTTPDYNNWGGYVVATAA